MNTDDGLRMNMQNHGMRKPMALKYPEKSNNYSPSTSYNYSPQSGYNSNNQQMYRRRPQPGYRRDVSNPVERIVRQNDIIIRLLKEIRDRLPEPEIKPQSDEMDQAAANHNAPEGWESEDQVQENCEAKNESTATSEENVIPEQQPPADIEQA
jgi:hypothetical protein